MKDKRRKLNFLALKQGRNTQVPRRDHALSSPTSAPQPMPPEPRFSAEISTNADPADNDGHETLAEKGPRKKRRRFIKRSVYRRRQQQNARRPVTVFKNFSSYEFEPEVTGMIENGGSFVPLPAKVNVTGTVADLKRFERKCVWKWWWHDKEEVESDGPHPVFPKPASTNLPQDPPPKALQEFLSAIKSTVLGSRPRKSRPNFTTKEMLGLESLIDMQKSGKIVVTPTDKTSGFACFDRQDYVQAMTGMLNETFVHTDGSTKHNYEQINLDQANHINNVIGEVLHTGHTDGAISDHEYNSMMQTEPKVGRFYGLAKDHKPYTRIPDFRPIASLCGSSIENIGKFVEHHIHPLVESIPTHLDDTPHFLRELEMLKNRVGQFPEEVVPITIDVSKLYPSIPIDEGTEAVRISLSSQKVKSADPDFIIALLQLVLTCNVVEFNKDLYLQKWGTSMGAACSPVYADIFMAKLEQEFLESIPTRLRDKIFAGFFKRFLDDIFILWDGSSEEFEEFMTLLNAFHTNIKFKAEHDFAKRTTTFLDVTISIVGGELKTDLYVKPTAANQYLQPNSCHPEHISRNIPYSLAFRIRRICSRDEDFNKRLTEFRAKLLERKYHQKVINAAFTRVRQKTREETLKKVHRTEAKKTALVTTYDPRLPNMGALVQTHYKTLTLDPNLKDVFKDGMVVGYKRHRNIKEFLFRARLYDPRIHNTNMRPKRLATRGWRRCSNCTNCKHSENRIKFTCKATGETFSISQDITCKDKSLIYLIECKKCQLQYVGKSVQSLMNRGRQHIQAVQSLTMAKESKLYKHYSSLGHSHADMTIIGIEAVHGDDFVLAARERFWMDKLQTTFKGLNSYRT